MDRQDRLVELVDVELVRRAEERARVIEAARRAIGVVEVGR